MATRELHAMLIDGREATAASARAVTDPATGETIAEVADGTAADAQRAVAAAKAAFARGDWSRATPGDRAVVLHRLADLLEEHAGELARVESRNTGKPLKFSSAFDVPLSIDNLRFFAAAARALGGRATGEYLPGLSSSIRREPLGVTAAIAPWNYPLNMGCWKIGPALAAGNSVVLKPSELTPLTTLMLARLALEAGLPPGVLNVVTGPGPEVGGALARHPDVALISVTGSTRTGASVMRDAADSVKRLHLELGGKAPFVVFADADLEAAAEGAIVGAFANCGQDCTAATRLVVDAAADSEIVQDEVFGPVVVVQAVDGEDEALAAANGVRYGLAASAWTRDVFRAQRAARELQAGTVWINEHLAICSEMPHGGVKGSGFGKDMSQYALEEYTAVKHVCFELTGAPRKEWYDAVSRPE